MTCKYEDGVRMAARQDGKVMEETGGMCGRAR